MRHSAQFVLAAALAAGPVLQASEPRPAASPQAARSPATQVATTTTPPSDPPPNETFAEDVPDVDRTILLDPGANRRARQDQLALLERHAAHGDGFGNYLLGTLYRLGDEHPTKLVERDPDRAETHLRKAALAGEVWAMAGLAELLLVEGELRAALLWAHAAKHYRSVYEQLAGWPNDPRQVYAADLVQRCRAALEDVGDLSPIQSELDAFVSQNDSAIRAGIMGNLEAVTEEAQAEPQNSLVRQPPSPKYGTHVVPLSEPGWALYRIGVDREGKVRHVHLIDFAPHPRFGRRFRGTARSEQFNRSPDADPLRWALLPIELSPRR
jgi:hypothetical protein